MKVLLVQTYALDASRKAVEALGHECRGVNYRTERIRAGDNDGWPDLVIIQQGDFKDGRCLDELSVHLFQDNGARVVWWTYDPPATKRHIYATLALACDEIVVCTADDLAWFGMRHEDVRLDYAGIDPGFWHTHAMTWREAECYGGDVAIVGHMYPDRVEAIKRLLPLGLKMQVWGRGRPAIAWLDNTRLRYVYQAVAINVVIPYRWGEEQDAEYLICRHFEIPACGGFMIAAESAAVKRHFPSVPTFRTLDEMVGMVHAYSARALDRYDNVRETQGVVAERFTLGRFFGEILARAAA